MRQCLFIFCLYQLSEVGRPFVLRSFKDSVRYRLVLVRRLDHYRLALAECPVGLV